MGPNKAQWATDNLSPKPVSESSQATADRLRDLLAKATEQGGRGLCRMCPTIMKTLNAALETPSPYRCGGDCLARARQVRYCVEAWLDWFDEQQPDEVEPA
jgi:hypothetical protein